jgi:hypothetical protein
MGGDARIRRISNTGSEVVRKPVKTAVKRHGESRKEGAEAPIARTSERITAVEARGPTTIMEGIATVVLSRGVRANTSAFWRKFLEYHRGARSVFSDRLAIGT